MKKLNIYELPLAANVCDQLLREVDRNSVWSVAHVLMNPKAWSLLHEHHFMREIYIITRGTGHLIYGEHVLAVRPGDAIHIPPNTQHKLTNDGIGSLEHLVLAAPPFDPADVYVDESWRDPEASSVPFVQPPLVDCFDGAKIIAYEFENIASVAFGWVLRDPERRKPAHYHKTTTEWIYVVEGSGVIEVDHQPMEIAAGDWVRIEPNELHALRNDNDQHMVVVCICTPCFNMGDVHYL